MVSQADDCTALSWQGRHIPTPCQTINRYFVTLNNWLKEHHLELSPGKSSSTLFTLWIKEENAIENVPIPIIGVTFDPLLTFNQHTQNVRNKMQGKTNGLKALQQAAHGAKIKKHFLYLSQLDPLLIKATADVCLDCGESPHETPHLFKCSAHPTNITVVKDLWSKPVEVANFLGLKTNYEDE